MDTNFKEVLKELAMVWHENNAPIIDNLAPGIDISYEDILSFTGKLPEEVKELYQWRNGIHSSRQDQLIGTLKLFELGIFMPLDKVRSFQQQMADDEFGWDASQLPCSKAEGEIFFLSSVTIPWAHTVGSICNLPGRSSLTRS